MTGYCAVFALDSISFCATIHDRTVHFPEVVAGCQSQEGGMLEAVASWIVPAADLCLVMPAVILRLQFGIAENEMLPAF